MLLVNVADHKIRSERNNVGRIEPANPSFPEQVQSVSQPPGLRPGLWPIEVDAEAGNDKEQKYANVPE